MSTTVATPAADETCAYCESRIFDHDPICVRDCEDDCGSPVYFLSDYDAPFLERQLPDEAPPDGEDDGQTDLSAF